jgi:hypothetical protein
MSAMGFLNKFVKYLVSISLFLFFGIKISFCQSKFLTLSFDGFYKNYTMQVIDSSKFKRLQNSFGNVLPKLRILNFRKSSFGFGIEIGYNISSYKNVSTNNTSQLNVFTVDSTSISQNSFLLGLYICEKIHFHNYIIVNSISIPLRYYGNSLQYSNSYTYNADLGNKVLDNYLTKIDGRPAFNSGLYYSLNVNRKVTKKIKLGIEINAGLEFVNYFGNTIKTNTDLINNIKLETIYKTKTAYQINTVLYPAFNITYSF